MHRLRSTATALAVGLLATALGAQTASAAPEPAEVGTLETASASNRDVPVFVSQPLQARRFYEIKVTGTSSVYARSLMDRTTPGWTLCGTTEATPLFPTPGVPAGPTGNDAEFVYAYPQPGLRCNSFNAALLPRRQPSIRFSKGGGPFTTPVSKGTTTRIDPDHVYFYETRGDGGPLTIKFQDSNYTDNAGRFRLEIKPVSPPMR